MRVLALKADGTVYTWGVVGDAPGALGDGNPAAKQDLLLPTRATVLESTGSKVVDVAMGFKSAFALRADGSLWAVGSNRYGELARADTSVNAVNPAVRISGSFSKVANAGYTRTYALGTNQVLYWWGESLPTGVQVRIPGNVRDFWPTGTSENANVVVHSGYALLTDDTVVAWGDNSHGAFGNATTEFTTAVVPVALPRIGVRDMRAGVAVMADGSLYLWGASLSGAPRFYKEPVNGLRTPISLTPTKVATGYKKIGLMTDGRVVRMDVVADTDGALVLVPIVEGTQAARLFGTSGGLCNAVGNCSGFSAGLPLYNPAIVAIDGSVRIRPSSNGRNVATGGVYTVDAFDYVSSVFTAAFEAPPPPVPGSGGGTGSGTGDVDALAYPIIQHSFTCTGISDTGTAPVSNGRCLSQEKGFAKATACNEFDSDFTFNSVGRPFFQCLVNNSTGNFKTYYQQSLTYYGG